MSKLFENGNRRGEKVRIHKPKFVPRDIRWWTDGMDKYDGYVGTIGKAMYDLKGRPVSLIGNGSEHVYTVEGAVGASGTPYWFGEGCFEKL